MMEFNVKTKISDIIKHDKSSIDAIASIAPPLKRLKNPILRKIMASRVTVKEAANMGGCKVEDFVRVLEPLGYVYAPAEDADGQPEEDDTPDWLSQAGTDDIRIYDVRPIIEDGTDPLNAIMAEFKKVDPGKILCIVNTFIPIPLINLLEKKQAEASYTKTISEKEYHTFFLKKTKDKKTQPAAESGSSRVMMHDQEDFKEICTRFSEEKTKEIDVRHLEMPGPMQTILGELGEMPAGNALYIHHKRVPVFLLEELAGQDFEVHIYNIAEGNVKMLIFHS